MLHIKRHVKLLFWIYWNFPAIFHCLFDNNVEFGKTNMKFKLTCSSYQQIQVCNLYTLPPTYWGVTRGKNPTIIWQMGKHFIRVYSVADIDDLVLFFFSFLFFNIWFLDCWEMWYWVRNVSDGGNNNAVFFSSIYFYVCQLKISLFSVCQTQSAF